MKIIKDKKITEDCWVILRNITEKTTIPSGPIIIEYVAWQSDRDIWQKRAAPLGLCIDGDTLLSDIIDDLHHFALIALDFPKFVDGRSYSHARLLRERYQYQGELRAIGEVLVDQLRFMHRCGVDSYTLPIGSDERSVLQALDEISVKYQPAADTATSVIQKRHAT